MVLSVVDDDEFCDTPDLSDPPATRTSLVQQLPSPSPPSPSPPPMRECGNNEVFKKSLDEGIRCGHIAWQFYHNDICAI